MATTREYECSKDGYFTLQVSIKAPTIGICPKCNQVGERVYTVAPPFTLKGSIPRQPDIKISESEYEGWQRAEFAKYDEKLHPDNVGNSTKLDVKSLTGHDSPTPIPEALDY
jgi:hypothetical protein